MPEQGLSFRPVKGEGLCLGFKESEGSSGRTELDVRRNWLGESEAERDRK